MNILSKMREVAQRANSEEVQVFQLVLFRIRILSLTALQDDLRSQSGRFGVKVLLLAMLKYEDYIRSAVFGFEDALVSTTGVIAGIATGTDNKKFIILAAFVTIMVEAVSMAAGQYLTERTMHEIDRARHTDSPVVGGVIMLFSYFIGGIIPALPVFLLPLPLAIIPAIMFAFIGLFALGYFKGKFVKISPIRSAMEMLVVGGVATLIGVVAGYFLKT